MKERKEKTKNRKADIPVRAGLVSAIIIVGLVVAFTVPRPMVVFDEDTLEWHVIWKGNAATAAEADPGSGLESGWLSFFCFDYAETPATSLATNATAGNYDTWGNVSGYQNTDNAVAMDLKSEDPFYFVARARFNKTHCWDDTKFIDTRCSIRLTVSGDETISDVEGTIAVSYNNTGEEWIWLNFWWDDGDDGYRITDDGSLAWNITISAKF